MENLEKLTDAVMQEGYNLANAQAKVCQDIVLKAIDASSFADHITVKGGVVMRSITRDARRATQDMDLDFIRYSLDDDSIRRFVERLNCLDGISIRISAPIEPLSQQEYNGKRVYVVIEDELGHALRSKIDLGAHKQIEIEQDEYCFDVCMDDEGASLLINSKEQIFSEKLRSLLRFGPFSTRYKDIFDMCFLADALDSDRLYRCIDTYILSDPGMRETTMSDIQKRVSSVFSDRVYQQRLSHSRASNWLNVQPSSAMNKIEAFLLNFPDQ